MVVFIKSNFIFTSKKCRRNPVLLILDEPALKYLPIVGQWLVFQFREISVFLPSECEVRAEHETLLSALEFQTNLQSFAEKFYVAKWPL